MFQSPTEVLVRHLCVSSLWCKRLLCLVCQHPESSLPLSLVPVCHLQVSSCGATRHTRGIEQGIDQRVYTKLHTPHVAQGHAHHR